MNVANHNHSGVALLAEELYFAYGPRKVKRRRRKTSAAIEPPTPSQPERAKALDGLSLAVPPENIYGVLGPNGSGKSTLFKLISTLAPMPTSNGSGEISVFGYSVRHSQSDVRSQMGIVFQSPSLDAKLTVFENIKCQSALYGLNGKLAEARIAQSIDLFGLSEKKNELCETLSGGQKRRVELAKGMLHRPRLLLLDEPSTGLDPAARRDFWQALERLRAEFGTTIVLTTHLMEEAEDCDEIAILSEGKCVASGAPKLLRERAGDRIVSIDSKEPIDIAEQIRMEKHLEPQLVSRQIRIASPDAVEIASWVSSRFGDRVDSVTVGRPSLIDVFVEKTGRRFE